MDRQARASRSSRPARPPLLWTALGVAVSAGAIAAAVTALVLNADAQRPIGEGQLFLADGTRAEAALADEPVDVDALRHLRNDLAIEAVGLVTPDGVIASSTSEGQAGAPLESPILADFVERGRFGAAAVPLDQPIHVDGMQEWDVGDVVYEVIQPLGDGRAVLLTYDISELLARRKAAREVPTMAIEMLGLAAFLSIGAIGIFLARGRAVRTYREFALESEFLKREAGALARHNAELDEARRRAERAFELAEEKNRIRSEFVLMINHELRTPLTGVVTGSELLRSEGAVTDQVWQEVLDDVLRDGRRLREMIDQILAVARIENRALFFELEDVPLAEVLGRLAASEPRCTLPPADGYEDVELHTDATSIVNLVHSLTGNALTHGASRVELRIARTPPFEPMVETGTRPEHALFLVVEDDGPGIDPGFLPRVFEKFEKRSRSSGTGLGLYIARMMAEALQSSIMVSTYPQGTAFAIAVPMAGKAEAAA